MRQPLVREGDGICRLSVHMSQRLAIGIDDPIPTGDWLKSPGSREAALRHGARISCAGAGGPLGVSGGMHTMNSCRDGDRCRPAGFRFLWARPMGVHVLPPAEILFTKRSVTTAHGSK